ncbi:MAG TPA: carboxypeptidase-like regulatory domain-containing protein [Longimicrobium sp.]|nr:carboxypeptidase-like regulatory domain-containing protein [Longimicrobium sp.]
MNTTFSRAVPVFALALALLSGAGGCLPIPHTKTIAPPIEGRFVDEHGDPITGARVALSTVWADSTCASPSSATTTDAGGRFSFERVRRRETWLPLMGDWFERFWVCAGTGERFGPGFGALLGVPSPRLASLTCKRPVTSPPAGTPLDCVIEPRRRAPAGAAR